MRLTQLIPTPRTVTLAGRPYRVWPATLRDLRDIDAWLSQGWTDPLDEVMGRLTGGSPVTDEERDELLRDALERAEEGPPTWDNERGAALMATAGGVVALLAHALRKGHPEMVLTHDEGWDGTGTPDVVTVAAGMSVVEYAALQRAFYGLDPVRQLEAMLFGAPKRAGTTVPFSQAVEEVIQTHPGWTYEDVYGLTLAEFANARRMGKEPQDRPGRFHGGMTQSQWDAIIKARSGKLPSELWGDQPSEN